MAVKFLANARLALGIFDDAQLRPLRTYDPKEYRLLVRKLPSIAVESLRRGLSNGAFKSYLAYDADNRDFDR